MSRALFGCCWPAPAAGLGAYLETPGSAGALFVGLATAVGAGISIGFSEALSDTGAQTGRGSAIVRGTVTGVMTAFGGVLLGNA